MASPLPPKRRYAGIRSGYRFRDPYISNRLSGQSGEITTVQEQDDVMKGTTNIWLNSPYGEGFSSARRNINDPMDGGVGSLSDAEDWEIKRQSRAEQISNGELVKDDDGYYSPTLAPLPEADSPNVKNGLIVNEAAGPKRPDQMTPEDVAQREQDIFAAQGGSERQMNQAYRAAGIKPRIDARTKFQQVESNPAVDSIRSKWGWGKTSDTASDEIQRKLPY